MNPLDLVLAECIAHPDDDAPRMVWADGIGGERGELVGLQCGRDELAIDELAIRDRRARQLLARHTVEWSGLAGLARRVRFRRGFVDAIETDAEMFITRGAEILERAPLITSLTVYGAHDGAPNNTGEAVDRLSRLLETPAFAQIRALDLVDRVSLAPWGDAAAQVIAHSGRFPQLVALGLPEGLQENGCIALGERPSRLQRLWLRGSAVEPAWLVDIVRNAPLIALDTRPRNVDYDQLAGEARKLTELCLRAAEGQDVIRLAGSALAPRLERLVVDPLYDDQISATVVRELGALRRLRSLDLRGTLTIREDALLALAELDLPELRELALGWTPSARGVRTVVERLGPQLERCDLRSTIRAELPAFAGQLLVDEPRQIELIHVGVTERASSADHPAAHHPDTARAPAWFVVESGAGSGRVWDLAEVGTIRIGRGINAGVVIHDGSVARAHAELAWNGSVHVIRDLQSTNGTLIDGMRIETEAALRDGAQLALGSERVRFFCGPGGGERATAWARRLATHDPMTGFPRKTREGAARLRVERRPLQGHGYIAIDIALAEVARRLRDAITDHTEVTAPGRNELAVWPADHAATVAKAGAGPIEIDGAVVDVTLEIVS